MNETFINYIEVDVGVKPLDMTTELVGLDGWESYVISPNKIGFRPKWIKFTEKMPEKNGEYLVYFAEMIHILFFENGIWEDEHGTIFEVKKQSYWMPLPKLPEAE